MVKSCHHSPLTDFYKVHCAQYCAVHCALFTAVCSVFRATVLGDFWAVFLPQFSPLNVCDSATHPVITIVGLTFVNSFNVCLQVDLSIGFIFTLSTLLIDDQMFSIFMKYHALCNIVT